MDFNQLEESDRMKYEIAEELGLLEKVQKGGCRHPGRRYGPDVWFEFHVL